MPNIITHKIFAEEVLKSMTKHDIRSMIERHPQIFYIGSNGPDFLFFSHIKPWESYKSHALNRLGSAMLPMASMHFMKPQSNVSAHKSMRISKS